jgi:hypothetical protein
VGHPRTYVCFVCYYISVLIGSWTRGGAVLGSLTPYTRPTGRLVLSGSAGPEGPGRGRGWKQNNSIQNGTRRPLSCRTALVSHAVHRFGNGKRNCFFFSFVNETRIVRNSNPETKLVLYRRKRGPDAKLRYESPNNF